MRLPTLGILNEVYTAFYNYAGLLVIEVLYLNTLSDTNTLSEKSIYLILSIKSAI